IDVLMYGLLAVDDARDFAALVAADIDDCLHPNSASDDALSAIFGRDSDIPPFLVDRAATDQGSGLSGRYCRQQHSQQAETPHRLPPCLTITIYTDCGVRV